MGWMGIAWAGQGEEGRRKDGGGFRHGGSKEWWREDARDQGARCAACPVRSSGTARWHLPGDAALRAVELYVTTKKAEPDFAQRATAALEAIEQEAAARRGAIQGLFGTVQAPDAAASPGGEEAGTTGTTERRGRRGGQQSG